MNARTSDTMDDQKYYDIVRKVDLIENKQITLDERLTKHETRFESVFEKLTNTLVSMDKKFEVFIQTQDAKFSTIEKMLKVGIPFIALLISGFWAYNTFVINNIDEKPVLQTQQLQIPQYATPIAPTKK